VAAANKILDDMGLKKDATGCASTQRQAIKILLEHGAHAPDIAPVGGSDRAVSEGDRSGRDRSSSSTRPCGHEMAANEIQSTVMWSHDRGWDTTP